MDRQQAITEIRNAFNLNIAELEAALKQGVKGYIYVWPQYWLGVQVSVDGKPQACRVDHATVCRSNFRAHFTNGRGEAATLMDRQHAIRCALTAARDQLAEMESHMA
jgi:hypothetical protein